MLFVSLTFLFLFLPCVIGVYYLVKGHRTVQNLLLLFASLFFYAWGEPVFVVVLLASVIINWLLALLIEKNVNVKVRRLYIVLAVVINIGLLFVFKYLNFILAQVNTIAHSNIPFKNIALPIGISFFTFQALSYVIDVYRGESCQKNPLYVCLYVSFFPQLIAGPIVRYNAVADQLINRQESFDKFREGTLRFIQGFTKKVLLANTMAVIADKAFELVGGELTISFAWLGAVAYSLQIFFDFAGYSDMAIGLGKMFGFDFEENFNYPYVSSSITEFWRRWHISLSRWFRDYVYIPLGGNRTGNSFHDYINLFIVWVLTGIWHGANWTFIVWGVLYFIFLLIEKATPFGKYIQIQKGIGHVYTLFVVIILWVIFRAEGIQQAVLYIKTMFGVGEVNVYSPRTWIYIKENIVYLLFALLLSVNSVGGIKNKVFKWVIDRERVYISFNILYEVCLMLLFLVSIVYVINGAYNPFIYFHF